MTGLPENLYSKCREIFLRCDKFNDQKILNALFTVEGLALLQNNLPEAPSKEKRVIVTLDYLLKDHSMSKPPLLIFLKVLAGYYDKETDFHNQIVILLKDISDYFEDHNRNKVVEIPTVSIAMTLIEAESLVSGKVFDDDRVPRIARGKFDQLQQLLKENGVADLLTFYGERREDWKIEYQRSSNTVENVVKDTMNWINKYRIPRGLIPIRPRFESKNFFDPFKKMETWSRLTEYGCLVIADAVSLFHPLLSETLLQSGIVLNDRVAIFIHYPINSQSFQINSIIAQYVNEKVQLAFHRFDEKLDKHCEFGLGGVRTLKRWLNAVVPDVEEFVTGERPTESNRKFMRDKLGVSRGIGQLITGSSRGRI